MWHADRIAEECGQVTCLIHTQEFVQPIVCIGITFREFLFQFRVVDVDLVTAPALAHDVIEPFVRADDVDRNDSRLLPLTDKFRSCHLEIIEQCETDSLQQRTLACAVLSADGIGPRCEGDAGAGVTLDVFEVYLHDLHLTPPPGESNQRADGAGAPRLPPVGCQLALAV
ncbi:MAG: hypothetical protein BWY63_01557 [Chloroflexi bacterium ADurb.Bin360]|nr:MAG: hypothetical protein BWY63_01557 [Chloroflexi bacterium ADurb.Bin360]